MILVPSSVATSVNYPMHDVPFVLTLTRGPCDGAVDGVRRAVVHSCRRGGKIPDAHEIVDRRRGKGEHPPDAVDSAMLCLLHQADRLEPAEDLLDTRFRFR